MVLHLQWELKMLHRAYRVDRHRNDEHLILRGGTAVVH